MTVVEINEDVIALFQKYILPQFPNAGKIDIVRGDAFAFAERELARAVSIFCLPICGVMSDGLPIFAVENMSLSVRIRYLCIDRKDVEMLFIEVF